MNKQITKEQVLKALDSLESELDSGDESVNKASENDLDQPEGADLGNPAKEKMSDLAPKPGTVKNGNGESKKSLSKARDDDEEEEGDEDEEEENPFQKKSFAESLPDEVQTKIDVSDFLKSLVDHTGTSIDSLRKYITKSEAAHDARLQEIGEVMSSVIKSQAKIGVVLKAICERIGVIENAPASSQKAETVSKAQGSERQFSSGLAPEGEDKVFKSLSDNPYVAKSQLSEALCDLVRKGEAKDLDVIGFESTGHIRPELIGKLKSALN